jgi:hypothetical protein
MCIWLECCGSVRCTRMRGMETPRFGSRLCLLLQERLLSSRLGASCQKTEAEPASETWCFSVLKNTLDNGQGPREEYRICTLHTVNKTLRVEVLCSAQLFHTRQEYIGHGHDTIILVRPCVVENLSSLSS